MNTFQNEALSNKTLVSIEELKVVNTFQNEVLCLSRALWAFYYLYN